MTLREAALHRQLEAELQQATQRLVHGDLDEAQRQFEKLAADDQSWIAPRQLLAETYYRTGRLADAQAQLDWLAEHAIEHPRLSLIAGAIALARRDFAAALEALEYAAYVEPDLPRVHSLLGTAQLRLGRLDDAQQSFQTAIQRHASDALAYDGLAAVHLRRHEFDDAANCALEALAHDMQLFGAHYRLGLALANLSRPNEAITALETAAKVDATRAAAYYWLSRIVAEQLGDPDRATLYRARAHEVVRHRRDHTA